MLALNIDNALKVPFVKQVEPESSSQTDENIQPAILGLFHYFLLILHHSYVGRIFKKVKYSIYLHKFKSLFFLYTGCFVSSLLLLHEQRSVTPTYYFFLKLLHLIHNDMLGLNHIIIVGFFHLPLIIPFYHS